MNCVRLEGAARLVLAVVLVCQATLGSRGWTAGASETLVSDGTQFVAARGGVPLPHRSAWGALLATSHATRERASEIITDASFCEHLRGSTLFSPSRLANRATQWDKGAIPTVASWRPGSSSVGQEGTLLTPAPVVLLQPSRAPALRLLLASRSPPPSDGPFSQGMTVLVASGGGAALHAPRDRGRHPRAASCRRRDAPGLERPAPAPPACLEATAPVAVEPSIAGVIFVSVSSGRRAPLSRGDSTPEGRGRDSMRQRMQACLSLDWGCVPPLPSPPHAPTSSGWTNSGPPVVFCFFLSHAPSPLPVGVGAPPGTQARPS